MSEETKTVWKCPTCGWQCFTEKDEIEPLCYRCMVENRYSDTMKRVNEFECSFCNTIYFKKIGICEKCGASINGSFNKWFNRNMEVFNP